MVSPTKPNTPSPVALIFSASSSARWSAQRMTFQNPSLPRFASCSSVSVAPVRETLMGVPCLSTTAREHVASNPMPLTCEGDTPEEARMVLQHLEREDQMSVVDCSKIRWSVGERWVWVGSEGSAGFTGIHNGGQRT